MKTDWFETFFTDVYPEYWTGWDGLGPERTEKEAAFAVQALEIEPPARVLDLCCGHGRHSLWLARKGYQVTGVDLTRRFLEMGRQAAEQESLAVRWVESDMRKIEFEREFDAAISMFTAFGYFEEEEDNVEVLRRLGRALRPGGRVLFDLPSRDALMTRYRDCDVGEGPNGSLIVERREFDPLTGVNRSKVSIFQGGRRRDYAVAVRMYALSELRRALEEAGLSIHRVYSDWDGSEFTRTSHRMLVVARK